MVTLLAASLLLQSATAPAQSEADKLEAALKKFGDREYRITDRGRALGKMSLKTRFEKEKDRTVAVFEDTVIDEAGTGAIGVLLEETASLEGLKLIRTSRTSEDKTEAGASIRDGDAYLSGKEGQLIIRDVRNALGERAVLRLVGMKVQKVGETFQANVFVLESPSDELVHDFKCVAKETIEIGGKKVEAFKWEQKWKGKAIRGGESVDAAVDNAYWVGTDGTLLRFKIGSNEMTLNVK
jgi:hypothetical protein